MLNALSGAGQWLVQSGKAIIDGLISGIKGAISGAKDAVSGALQSIRDLFPFSPAKEGPVLGQRMGCSTQAAASPPHSPKASPTTPAKPKKRCMTPCNAHNPPPTASNSPYRSTIGRTDTATAGYGGDQRTNVTNITQNITTVQDDPRKQALAWGRYAGKAFAGTGGV